MVSIVNERLTNTLTFAGEERRLTCALLAFGLAGMDVSQAAPAATAVEDALAERFALKRRAYQTGDANLLRSFYADDIVIVREGGAPLLGIEPVIVAYKALLPKRRDIEVTPLRSGHSPDTRMAWEFVRFVSFPKDPAEKVPVATFLFLWRQERAGWRCFIESLLLQDLALTPGFPVTSSPIDKKGAV